MPITRALSSRLRSGSRRQSTPAAAINHPTEDMTALKSQAQAAAAMVEPARALVASALAQLNVHNTAKDAGSTSGSSSYAASTAASTTSASSRPRYSRGTRRLSSRRSVLGSSEFGDSSDDENDDKGQQRRIGGCSSRIATTDQPDDSNKENVAPFRCTSQDVLDAEARDVQHEHAIRRTTPSRRTSLMERPSFASSPRLSRSSTVSDLSASQGEFQVPRVSLCLQLQCYGSPDRLAAGRGCSSVTLQNGPKNSTLDGHILCCKYAARDAASHAASQPSRCDAPLDSACPPVCQSATRQFTRWLSNGRVSPPKCLRPAADAFFPSSRRSPPSSLLPPSCLSQPTSLPRYPLSHHLLFSLFIAAFLYPAHLVVRFRHTLIPRAPHPLSPCQLLPSREPPRGD